MNILNIIPEEQDSEYNGMSKSYRDKWYNGLRNEVMMSMYGEDFKETQQNGGLIHWLEVAMKRQGIDESKWNRRQKQKMVRLAVMKSCGTFGIFKENINDIVRELGKLDFFPLY